MVNRISMETSSVQLIYSGVPLLTLLFPTFTMSNKVSEIQKYNREMHTDIQYTRMK